MANSIKVTKAQRFSDIIAMMNGEPTKFDTTPAIAVEVLNHEIELLARKNTSDKKPSAQQQKNEGIKSKILEVLSANPNRMFTATEVLKALDDPDLSLPRVTALITQMKDAHEVERIEEKRKAFFRVAM